MTAFPGGWALFLLIGFAVMMLGLIADRLKHIRELLKNPPPRPWAGIQWVTKAHPDPKPKRQRIPKGGTMPKVKVKRG